MLAPSLRLNSRFKQLLALTVALTVFGWLYLSLFDPRSLRHIPLIGSVTPGTGKKGVDIVIEHDRPWHTIDTLRQRAQADYAALLERETTTLQDAAQMYERRRGRRPPPGFDTWFKFAQENDALVIEEFFDRIYDDLNPFWALPPLQIRQQANDFEHRISVRNGNMSKRTDLKEGRPWMNLWGDLVGTIAKHLPDLDMPINVMDESRMIVPWEEIDGYMTAEKKSRRIVDKSELVTHFTNTSVSANEEVPAFDPQFGFGNYWELAVIGCSPHSPARSTYTPQYDFTQPPPLPKAYPPHSYEGYVQNWTLTKSPCDNPEIQQLHGTFVEPISMSNSKVLFPLFGGSKLPMNNEILLPPAMYWTTDPFYSGGEFHGEPWAEKDNKLIWRGAASGGRNKLENWTRFQRHRFVAMMNGTTVSQLEPEHLAWTRPDETGNTLPPNIAIPDPGLYNLTGADTAPGSLGTWISEIADTAFVHLLCFPDPNPPHCEYTDPWYDVAKEMPMKEQYASKYLPDIDGNSFSGRYRGFLGSTSLPIKATIYDEWGDSRLIPWIHFVPMDNTFVDIYGILKYFMGGEGGKGGHDDVAEEIAMGGKAWAEKVMRREDMQVYVFRLLLEYARVCDDQREVLGWVGE